MNIVANQHIFESIASYFRRLISINVFKAGDALPSVREVAVSEKVNPNTVLRAYGVLQDEGLIVSIPKKGYFVAEHEEIHDTRPLEKALKDLLELGYTVEEIRETLKVIGGKQ